MGIMAIPSPIQVVSHSFPFPFPISSPIPIPMGIPWDSHSRWESHSQVISSLKVQRQQRGRFKKVKGCRGHAYHMGRFRGPVLVLGRCGQRPWRVLVALSVGVVELMRQLVDGVLMTFA